MQFRAIVLIVTDHLSCDFEDINICGYIQEGRKDSLDWTRHHGYSGLDHDHTYGNHPEGFYMYFDSGMKGVHSKGRLLSPYITLDGGTHSVSFWYNMYGRGIGTLNAYLKRGNILGPTMFQRTGNQGQGWQQAVINIPSGIGPFRIIFEGVMNNDMHVNIYGDMAIDDIKLNGTHVDSDTISCDFEDVNICGYTQDHTDQFDWERHSGYTSTGGTGPDYDHTIGANVKGFDMYLRSSVYHFHGSITTVFAQLLSQVVTLPNGLQSLSFWYSMGHDERTTDCCTLNVYLKYANSQVSPVGRRSSQSGCQRFGNKLGSPVFQTSGDNGRQWREAVIDIPGSVGPFQLVFEGVFGRHYCFIAIDDIKLIGAKVDGSWSLWTTWSQCSKSCDLGSTVRTRICNNPDPSGGGNNCTGETIQTKNCNAALCQATGTWSSWFVGQCSVTCGQGTTMRVRQCSTGHQEDCAGNTSETVTCNPKPCPTVAGAIPCHDDPNLDCMALRNVVCSNTDTAKKLCPATCNLCGNGGTWSSWFVGQCSVTCGQGTTMRVRQCSTGHQEDCAGNTSETVTCNPQPCQVPSTTTATPGPQCISAPCKNGGTCEDLPGTFNCFCTGGYYGRTCEDDYDECVHRKPCVNGGTCLNTVGSYMCLCPAGFNGQTCQDCSDNPTFSCQQQQTSCNDPSVSKQCPKTCGNCHASAVTFVG